MNRQAEFTPGPWHVGMKPGPIIYGPKGDQVADLRGDLMLPSEQLANVRLIVAAPELYEALLAISRAHESGNNGAYMGEAVLCGYFAEKARQALARAEGRAS